MKEENRNLKNDNSESNKNENLKNSEEEPKKYDRNSDYSEFLIHYLETTTPKVPTKSVYNFKTQKKVILKNKTSYPSNYNYKNFSRNNKNTSLSIGRITKGENIRISNLKTYNNSTKKGNLTFEHSVNNIINHPNKTTYPSSTNIPNLKKINKMNNRIGPKSNILKSNKLYKLYGYNKKFFNSRKKLVQNKELIELDDYQNRILKISNKNLSRDNLTRLYTELRIINQKVSNIKPLPPINYPALIRYSFKQVEEKGKIIKTRKKLFKNMDEYEKELYEIEKSKVKKRKTINSNKKLFQIYAVLPEYVIDVLKKNNKYAFK